ncbi:hypothetical protein [Allomesorhizobium camelthorni]|uniref:Uncharacterized protein n=1 Tax=Allomesorhizobium camelthorni TaxID=475069 RepID=A0A6G4WBH6_9HYPH|nr:hypothetical protein [Mesorhizobium camelthorni]NGO51586.1 hypothetical protein [Mesorhizobium camelthorni]
MAAKRRFPGRAPLTDKELWHLTAEQFSRLALTDDEKARLREINKENEQERMERAARLRIEEEPILADLRGVGRDVNSVWDLANSSSPYPQAIPILLKHLLRCYSDRTREGIARALAVPEMEVHEAWPVLVEEYRKAPMGKGILGPGDTKEYRSGAKDGLACALSVAATDATLPELIALAKDCAHGESRVLLLSALKKRRNTSQLAKQAIENLASDPELTKEIASWRKR